MSKGELPRLADGVLRGNWFSTCDAGGEGLTPFLQPIG